MEFNQSKINQSRIKALEKIKEILSKENVDEQFKDVSGGYYSKDKFIVSWFGNWNGSAVEYSIDKVDSFTSAVLSTKAIYVRRNLFSEKQLSGYHSIERALIENGIKLCSTKNDKITFFNRFAKPYNERLKL